MTVSRQAPGPRGHFLFGSALDFRRDPLGLIVKSREQFGDVVRYRMSPLSVYQITHPDGVEQVLQTHHKYSKGLFHKKVKLLGGEGLVSSEGDFWLRQRRLAQPAFYRQRLTALADCMTKAAQEAGDRWKVPLTKGQSVEISEEMSHITLEIVGWALLGSDLDGRYTELSRSLLIGLEYIDYRMNNPVALPQAFPTKRNRRFKGALRELDTFVFGLIGKRRREGDDSGDLLSMLLFARDDNTGEAMSDRQVRDEVMTMLLAGHETSAMALTWAWYLLSLHPEIEHRLHEELDSVLGGRIPGFDDLSQLPHVRMIVDETLRLYPPAWGVERQSIDEDDIGGFRIPKGVQLFVSSYATHRHPDFWESPDLFDPERFLPERSKERPRFAYYPFGGGPRKCIGSNFALMEMQLILATLAQRYRLAVVPEHPVEVQPVITLRPRQGIMMTLNERV